MVYIFVRGDFPDGWKIYLICVDEVVSMKVGTKSPRQ